MLATSWRTIARRAVPGLVNRALAARRSYATNLFAPLSGVPTNEPFKQISQQVQVTTLENGLRIASFDNNDSISSIGVFVDAGTRNETPASSGASQFLKHLAFKSNHNMMALTLVRQLETLGANFSVSYGREQISYVGETPRTALRPLLQVLRDVALKPRFALWEIRDHRQNVRQEGEEFKLNPQTVVVEAIHKEAFRNTGLGMPLACPEYNLHAFDSGDALRNFTLEHFVASQTAVVGVGIPHQDLVNQVRDVFVGELEPAARALFEAPGRSARPLSPYVGGETRIPESTHHNNHVALVFPGAGLNDKDYFALQTLHNLLGGGPLYGSEGPGRGYSSRLFRNVVRKAEGGVVAATAFSASYSDAGLFGVYGEASPGHLKQLADLLAAELGAAARGDFSEEEVARAKNQVRSSVLSNTESRVGLANFIAGQLLLSPAGSPATVDTPAQFVEDVKAVTASDVARAAKRVLSGAPTVVALGEGVHKLPTREQWKKW